MYSYLFTKEITSTTVHEIYTHVFRIRDKKLVVLDFSNVTFIDPEGSNFIILLIGILKNQNVKVGIVLPYRQDVYIFLVDSGIYNLFHEFNFEIIRQYSLFDSFNSGKSYSYNQIRAKNNSQYIPFFKSFYLNDYNLSHFYGSFKNENSIMVRNAKLFSRATSCFSELLSNLFQHSEVSYGSISIHFKNETKDKIPYLFISVTDFGIGIKKSLLKSPLFQSRKIRYQDDEFFINAALQPGISSTNKYGRGAGLSIVLNKSDKLIVSSGTSRVSITKKKDDYSIVESYKMKEIPKFRGTSIVCVIKNNLE